jgi:hypothetical protein
VILRYRLILSDDNGPQLADMVAGYGTEEEEKDEAVEVEEEDRCFPRRLNCNVLEVPRNGLNRQGTGTKPKLPQPPQLPQQPHEWW